MEKKNKSKRRIELEHFITRAIICTQKYNAVNKMAKVIHV